MRILLLLLWATVGGSLGQAQPKIKMQILAVRMTNATTGSPFHKGLHSMGWIDEGGKRDILVARLCLTNQGNAAMKFGDKSRLFVRYNEIALLKQFVEITLLDPKGRVIVEKFTEAQFKWPRGFWMDNPGLKARDCAPSAVDHCGSVIDVTGLAPGRYTLVARINPHDSAGVRWPVDNFDSVGDARVIEIGKGFAWFPPPEKPEPIIRRIPPGLALRTPPPPPPALPTR